MTIIALRLAEAKVGTEGDAELILHRILAYLTPVQDSATAMVCLFFSRSVCI